MSTQQESNGFLYFMVGALLVAVAVMGFFYMNGTTAETGGDSNTFIMTEPASGENESESSESSFNLEIGEDGISGSATTSDSESE